MAPPKPPFPTHQTTSTTAPKCHHHGRHTQHQPQQLEELPTPATKGRACGSALPPVRKTSAAHSASLDHLPATPGPDSSFGLVADGWRSTGKLMESSSRRNQSPPPAEIAVADIQLQAAGTGNSDDLGPIGRRGHVEGVEGLAGLLPEFADSTRSSNAGQLNFTETRPEGALRVFDIMPQRSQYQFPACEVRTEDGEVWEKGHETIVRDRSSIRATFSSYPQGPSSSPAVMRCSGQQFPAKTNAEETQRPRTPSLP